MDQLNPTEDLDVAELNIKVLINDMNYLKKGVMEGREGEREREREREGERERGSEDLQNNHKRI